MSHSLLTEINQTFVVVSCNTLRNLKFSQDFIHFYIFRNHITYLHQICVFINETCNSPIFKSQKTYFPKD